MEPRERRTHRIELMGISSIAVALAGCTLGGQLDVAMGAAALTLLGAGALLAAAEERTAPRTTVDPRRDAASRR